MTSCNQLHSITACNIQASPSPAFHSLKRYGRIAAQPQLDPSKSRQNAPKKLRYGHSYSFRSAFAFCVPDGSSTVTCILCMQASLNSNKNNVYVLASLPDQTSQNISQLLSPSSSHHAQHGNHQVPCQTKHRMLRALKHVNTAFRNTCRAAYLHTRCIPSPRQAPYKMQITALATAPAQVQ